MNFLPGPGEWLFSAKTFGAAMLALYIGLATGLDRPYWALATVYIVSQPLSGALRSKALYRLLGTLLGAIVCVVLVPNLVNAPELLSVALAAWTGLCLYVSLLDRTPRSYVFMLAGYTAAIIGFPSVTAPDATWDTALWRVEEISLGIVCSTVIGSVVFPRGVGPVLLARIRAWLADAGEWADDVLGERPDTSAAQSNRARLAGDVLEIGQLAVHLAFDTSAQRSATAWVRLLRQRMVQLPPILSSIADRIAALRSINDLTPDLRGLLAVLVQWRHDCDRHGDIVAMRKSASELRRHIADEQERAEAVLDWRGALRISLFQRLRELIDIEQDCRVLMLHIAGRRGRLDTPLAFRQAGSSRVHRDHGMAALSALAAFLTVLVICAFWIAASWQAGAVAAEMAAVVCSFFAARDDPVPAIKTFLFASVAAVALDTVLLFAVLPVVRDFETLAFALGLVLLPPGALIPMPAAGPAAMALAANGATFLGIQQTYTADFAGFMDTGVAATLGMAVAAVMTSLIRSVGAEWSARRLLRRLWADLAEMAGGGSEPDAATLTGLSLDRLGLAAPRLAAGGADSSGATNRVLADLRVGRNLLNLHRIRGLMTPSVRQAIDAVLDGAAAHFAAQVRDGATIVAPASLLRAVDAALDATSTGQARRRRDIVLGLVGIRRALFASAPPYRAETETTAGYQAMVA